MHDLTLLKIGGAELQEGPLLDRLVREVVGLADGRRLIIVHGGGKDIALMQERLGIEPCYLEGLRVTDDVCLDIAEMVLSGTVNKRLTARLVTSGVRAIGISGVDGGLLMARKLTHPLGDLGRVGEVAEVDTSCLVDLVDKGFTPVVSPVSLGEDGRPYNVNADHVALAIAAAMPAEEIVFLTDVPGVILDGVVLPSLTQDDAAHMIDGGAITGGMIPKVQSALRAVEDGVGRARITDLEGLSRGTGTTLVAE